WILACFGCLTLRWRLGLRLSEAQDWNERDNNEETGERTFHDPTPRLKLSERPSGCPTNLSLSMSVQTQTYVTTNLSPRPRQTSSSSDIRESIPIAFLTNLRHATHF